MKDSQAALRRDVVRQVQHAAPTSNYDGCVNKIELDPVPVATSMIEWGDRRRCTAVQPAPG